MANYDNLTPGQQEQFDRLMTQPTNQWPPALITHVRQTGGPFCGDALADAVAGWVRRPAAAPAGYYRDDDGTLKRQHDVYGGPHDEEGGQ